ncbi:hypothetical protein [Ectopseudomonas guguanensis]|jgi:hypothetical protein|uniref:Uncharacterized protein n=1 Tax=Ectopseudomonas guguanensis TaxID=1198456 RepID=A0A1H0WQ30_9GAMM|nr:MULTISPECIES: hypothetical protein [Pseudomonas]MDR8017338.1 hypothetical protein [Pseudomonas guguanensis]MPT21172.1 hypothetical protein [Pseudomonas sp.]WJH57863.1 hypothetical protein FE254_17640 [Pseudomonas guguanensis]SDP92804.1 hypothetical protein SAMN05216213_107250 [Pseudomonas guguanensis]
MTGKDRVIHLHRRDPQEALTRLNRITGLRFARWPESLLEHAVSESLQPEAADASSQPSPSAEVSSA